ncbi:Metallothiol transferase fosB [Melia azedarach]|uniref:Metallothiol transferase fosB n=1 Tax=Melia azedarach TaxID=155640 RepID=A0ACC1Y4I7_MELAZ|nr:Metallothiol transferase fosB [Melia azedarach]
MGNIGGEIEEIEKMIPRMLSFSATGKTKTTATATMPVLSLNHVSFICKSAEKSVKFYEEVLGFVVIKRPSSFNFQGAWLFNHGVGIHLLETDKLAGKKGKINPKDNHISFQCSDMELVIKKLEEMKIEFVTAIVEEGGITVDQLFFHDPDGYMIEICNCQNLPVLPLSSCPLKLPSPSPNHTASSSSSSSFFRKRSLDTACSGEVAALMMENLVVDMMDISM